MSIRKAQPQRLMTQYTLSADISTTGGLTSVPQEKFTKLISSGYDANRFYPAPVHTDIGFDFSYVDTVSGATVTHRRMVVTSYGYIVLVDESEASTDPATIIGRVMSGAIDDSTMLNAGINTADTVLCPWFTQMQLLYDDASQLNDNDTTVNAAKTFKFEHGIMPADDFGLTMFINQRRSGVWIKKCDETAEGRRTIVRWYARPDEYNGVGGGLPRDLVNQIHFECVIYENGKIEYRYAPMEKAFETTPDSAIASFNTGSYVACGVFPGCSVSNSLFRDFSSIHPEMLAGRQNYPLGGVTYDSTWLDSTGGTNTVYSHSMTTSRHWFGRTKYGATLTFAPPTARATILPRKAIRKLDSTSAGSEQQNFAAYDDRRTIPFTAGVVSMPTKLPRYVHGNTQLTADTQCLYSEDILFTGTFDRNATGNLLAVCSRTSEVGPYSEDRQFTLVTSASTFFSSSGVTTPGLSSQLRDKTQIRIAFPIENKTTLFDVTGSVLYFNFAKRQFQVAAPNDLQQSVVPPNGVMDYDWNNTSSRMFSPFGTSIASGNIVRAFNTADGQTVTWFGDNYEFGQSGMYEVLESRFDRDSLLNADYAPTSENTFSLPIEDEFLIEKVVVDVPIEAGVEWLNDKTTFAAYYGKGIANEVNEPVFHAGGPAITFALLHSIHPKFGGQIELSASCRNVIAHGVLTHRNDVTSSIDNIIVYNAGSAFSTVSNTLCKSGFLDYGTPGGVVECDAATQTFTGSVSVQMNTDVRNGVCIKCTRPFTYTDTGTALDAALRDIFCKKFVDVGSYTDSWTSRVMHVNPYQRNNAGLALPGDGRSLFGGQYAAPTIETGADAATMVRNPFFIDEDLNNVPAYLTNFSGSTTCDSSTAAVGFVSILEGSSPSPYVVRPNDSLMIALAKSRSTLTGTFDGISDNVIDYLHKHDIKINTGTLYVTVYGSYVKEAKEFHNVSRRVNDSRSVYATILGNDPVLDQHEVDSRLMYYGSYTDAHITGSLATKTSETIMTSTGKVTTRLATGSRGRVFSKTLWFDNATPFSGSNSTNLASKLFDGSMNYADDQHFIALSSSEERIYDSMMPDVSELMKIDGTAIMRHSSAVLPEAGIFIDYPYVAADDAVYKQANHTWFESFPFEERYANVKRQVDLSKTFISKHVTNGSTITATSIKNHNGLWFATPWQEDPSTERTWWLDLKYVGASTSIVTFSKDDVSRFLFGYAKSHLRKYSTRGGTPTYIVSNNTPKTYAYVPNSLSIVAHVKPLIEGWKYGVYNGLPAYTKCTWRRGHYGQFRDMLEQRIDTKFFIDADQTISRNLREKSAKTYTSEGVVKVRFTDRDGKTTLPENTWSSNLSLEATSSVPYFDGEVKNRSEPDKTKLNLGIVTMNQDLFGNIKV